MSNSRISHLPYVRLRSQYNMGNLCVIVYSSCVENRCMDLALAALMFGTVLVVFSKEVLNG